MKRTKPDQPNPITLSSKRQTQDKFNTPNKTEWTTPLQSMDGNNNKSFFTHMKAQLSNIKNDFERLIQRQEKPLMGTKQLQAKIGWQTSAKGKSFSSYKQEDKPILFDKYAHFQPQTSSRNRETGGDTNSKNLGVWKNISEAVNFKNRHVALKEKETSLVNKVAVNPKEEQAKQFNFINLTPRMEVAQAKSKELLLQTQNQKQIITRYQQEITIYKQQNAKSKYQIIKLSQQNTTLKERVVSLQAQILSTNNSLQQEIIAKVTSLQTEIASKTTSLQSLQGEIVQKVDQIRMANHNIQTYRTTIKELEQKISRLQNAPPMIIPNQQAQSIQKEREEMEKQRIFYNQKINELSFYNNNLYNDNVHLTQQNHQIKEAINHLTQQNQQIKQHISQQQQTRQISQAFALAQGQNQHLKGLIGHLQNIIEDCKRTNIQTEKELKRKLQYLQKNINQYQKRQLMFQAEIEKLYSQINNATPIHTLPLHQASHIQLQQQVDYLRSQVIKQQQINEAITNKYKQQIDKLNIQQITQHLESTIHSLSDQNHRLKNLLNFNQSKLEELQQKCRSYSQQVFLYQEREKEIKANRSLSSTQWEQMADKIEQLLAENKRLTEQRDYKQLLRETQSQDHHNQQGQQDSILKVAKDQLQQISQLHFQNQALKTQLQQYQQEIAQLNRKKNHLEDQIKVSSMQKEPAVASLLKKYDDIHNELEHKCNTIFNLKNLLRQIILSKKSEEEQIATFQQIDSL